MRRTWAAVAVGAALLAGCGSSGATDTTSPPAAASTPTESASDVFLRVVRQNDAIDVSAVSDEALITAGQETCGALDRGEEPLAVMLLAIETGGDAGAVIMGAAVGTMCRTHVPALEALQKSLT